jgi:hypothetical protein
MRAESLRLSSWQGPPRSKCGGFAYDEPHAEAAAERRDRTAKLSHVKGIQRTHRGLALRSIAVSMSIDDRATQNRNAGPKNFECPFPPCG